jgi:hypothetical protein
MSSESTSIGHPLEHVTSERFRILRQLGEGMLGTSFEASPVADSIEEEAASVVLKQCTHFLPADLHRFQQEFDALCRLEHPGLIRFRELVVDEGHFYIVREFGAGIDLKTYLERDVDAAEIEALYLSRAGADEDDLSAWADTGDEPITGPVSGPVIDPLDLVFHRLDPLLPGLLSALEYLHRFRKVHGNLKPSNVIVTPDGTCRLVDYGLVQHLVPEEGKLERTPYDAPEIEDIPRPTSASDLFALGAMLYEAISGRPPRSAGDEQEPVFLSELAPGCPAGWVELIHSLLDLDPARRPNVTEVRRLLETTEARSVEIPPSIVDEQAGFLGRDEHLESLVARARRCAQSRCLALTIVEGATGVGKSALVDAVGHWASQHGWLVVRGKCYDVESVPFQGWDEIIRQLAYLIDQLPEKIRLKIAEPRRRAGALFPVLIARGEAHPETTTELPVARTTTTPLAYQTACEALRQVISEVARQRPILITLDDVHHISSDTARLMADLLGDPEEMACLVIATQRPSTTRTKATSVLKSELSRAATAVDSLHLAPFTKSEARQYVLSAAPELAVPLKQEVLRQGAFHPLLLEELIYEHQNGSASQSATARGFEDGADAPPEQALAASPTKNPLCGEALIDERISAMVRQRLAQLSRPERLVLQLLAVASSPLPAPLFGRVLASELGTQYSAPGTAQEIAERLVSLRLVKRTRGLELMQPHLPRYVVLHEVGRKIILAELGRDHHARLCMAIADAVEAQDPDRADLRFEYLQRTNRAADTAQAAREAAANARRRFAFHRAVRLWRWVVEHITTEGALQKRTALLELARCEYLAGNYDRSAELYERLGNEEARGTTRARLRLAEARAWLAAGDPERLAQVLDNCLADLGVSLHTRPLIGSLDNLHLKVRNLLSWSNLMTEASSACATEEQRLEAEIYAVVFEAIPFLEGVSRPRFEDRLIRLARQTRDAEMVREAYFQRSPLFNPTLVLRHTPWPEALHRQLKSMLDRVHDDVGQALYPMVEASLLHHTGELERARQGLSRGNKAIARLAHREDSLLLHLARVRIALAIDEADYEAANRIACRLRHQGRHDARAQALAHAALAEISLIQGKIDDVPILLEQARQAIPAIPGSLWQVGTIRIEALWNLAMGRPDVAVAQLDLWVDQWSYDTRHQPDIDLTVQLTLGHGLAALAEAQRLLGHPRQAETLRRLKACTQDLEKRLSSLDGALKACIYRLMARFETIKGRYPRALRHAHAAISAIETHPFPVEQSKCAEVRALILVRMEKPEARQALEQARALYSHYGAQLPLILEGWPVPRSFSKLRED